MNAFLLKLALPTILPGTSSRARRVAGQMARNIGERAIPKAPSLPTFLGEHALKALESAPQSASRKVLEAAKTVVPGAAKIAAAAFLFELDAMIEAGAAPPQLQGKFAEAQVEELLKEALNLQGVGTALKGGLQSARGAVASAAGKISPTLNKPVMGLAQGAAHKLQHSPNSFAQGVGNVLHHKTQTPGKALLAVANPVGTAAEALTAGAGTAASKGLAAAGGRLQQAAGAGQDAVTRAGRAMTPKGRLMNAAENFGGRLQQSFSPGGTGHNVATKHLPLAGEIGGAVGAGLALHAPVGLAGAAGKLGLMGLGKAAPAIGAAMEHAPGVVDAAVHKVAPAVKGVGAALQHGAEDVLGTVKQNLAGKIGRPAAAVARHSMLPPAMA